MLGLHYVRVGALATVGCFQSAGAECYARGTRVVCRTPRGLEVGEVLSAAEGRTSDAADGTLLRRITAQDDLLLARLERNREAAYRACEERLIERGIDATLVDVEHLFDGQSLYFYFLGETTPELDALTAELAEVYEAQVQFRKFTETLLAGCGPGCGTDEAENGCASGGCSTCAVACAVSKRQPAPS
ncbi:MAG: PSP1 domain-containing protein [Pirellulaceae bacterium]|jgi:cell fate regulator YaaT (PSP1 superfamily)|nr:PSP1 domain-containing protein [Pirellulaceae bacterium]